MTTRRSAAPAPRARPGALTKVRHVRTELAALYRDARAGRIEPGEATKLAHLLSVLMRAIELEEVEGRLDVLEEREAEAASYATH